MSDPGVIISQALADAAKMLGTVSDSPLLDCQLLLGHVLNKERQWFYGHSDETIATEHLGAFKRLVEKRSQGEPLAYLTGYRHFWKREFKVNPSTLIPRPETELLVETICEQRDTSPLVILDLGTGSGVIAISLAAERPAWSVTGIDMSGEALEVAAINGSDLQNVSWRQASWCEGIDKASVDVIVSNPPYVVDTDPHLGDLTFEPISALAAGSDGLDCIREIIPASYDCLRINGMLILEHGYHQQDAVVSLFSESGFAHVETLRDIQANPRAVMGIKQ